MPGQVTLEIKADGLPVPSIDEDVVTRWIQARLNGARNRFVRSVSAGKPNPSKPGEYPRTDTGRLVNSAATQMVHWNEGSLRSDVAYAEYLTRGTPMMAPREQTRLIPAPDCPSNGPLRRRSKLRRIRGVAL